MRQLVVEPCGKEVYFGPVPLVPAVSGRPLEGETTLWTVWPSLDSLSATTLRRPGTCRALESLVSWYTRSRFSIIGHKAGPTCLLPCLCMAPLWCCWLLQVLPCLSKGLGTLLKSERLLQDPDSLYVACFLEVTRTLLQSVRLSERPTLLLMHL